MTVASPFSMAWLKGRNSISRNRPRDAVTTGSSLWESVVVSPWPGKCLPQAITLLSCKPAIVASPKVDTCVGVAPNARSPMMGFSEFVLRSKTGARFMLIPTARSSVAVAAAAA